MNDSNQHQAGGSRSGNVVDFTEHPAQIQSDNYPAPRCYTDHFAKQVAQSPNAIAAVFQEQTMSYEDLDKYSHELAQHLHWLGVQSEVLVAIALPRSLEMLVALLAVWKAAGAYLPLDPSYPDERLKFMLSDSRSRFLISDDKVLPRLAEPGLCTIRLDDLRRPQSWQHSPSGRCSLPRPGEENLAYVIYTSGSTGNPKGVEISYGAVLNHNVCIAARYQLGPSDRVMQFAALSFDVSIEEIFPTWLRGGTVVLRDGDIIASIPAFLDFVARSEITVLNLPTAFWHELTEQLRQYPLPPSVRLVVIGGEQPSSAAYRRWRESVRPEVKLINAYGPTEATITATLFEVTAELDPIPIGRPIDGVCTLVLNKSFEPVPTGEIGELYLGGAGLARAYLNRPELTAERFIPNPVGGMPARPRVYRTGDLVRLGPDRNLEFVGRADQQVKIRGFRIELAGIESVLQASECVRQAVVVAREEPAGTRQLVAYFVPAPGHAVRPHELRQHLRNKLPAYMVPSKFISLECLPLTPAGKVDRKALPPPKSDLESENALPPQNEVEQKLCRIWCDALHLRSVGIRDNFFELGGDSLLGLRLISRIRESFRQDLPLATLFDAPTIEELACKLVRSGFSTASNSAPPLKPARRDLPLPASSVQERLWFLNQLDAQSDAYNMASAARIHGPLDPPALERALNDIVARHEALRTSLLLLDSTLTQVVSTQLRLALPLTTLEGRKSHRERELLQLLAVEFEHPFDLAKAPLLRTRLFRLNPEDHALSVVMHHTISDGWSMNIFYQELATRYKAYSSNSPLPDFQALPVQYVDYAVWQKAWLNRWALEEDLKFWKLHLADAPQEVAFPHCTDCATKRSAVRRVLILGTSLTNSVANFARSQRATPFMLMMATLALALYKWTRQKDLVVGTVVAGRDVPEVENLIGCFMNFLPLRIRLEDSATAAAFFAQVRRTVLDTQAHQNCPYEKIVAAVHAKRNAGQNPLYNVALLWHNAPPGWYLDDSSLRVSPIAVSSRNALLDLRLEAFQQNDNWVLNCEYEATRFNERAINEFLGIFVQALEFLVKSPDTTLDHFPQRSNLASSWLARARRVLTTH
jgi:amino acid adenylation domain-containing protein